MAATASVLATAGGGTTQPLLGPCLYPGMGEAAMLERLNSWGVARDRELVSLRADLVSAQAGVSGAFGQAERALLGIATDWRLESEAMRTSAHREASAALARLELVVGDARARFVAQDATRSADLVELSRRLSIIDGWAQAEPQRVAALLRAAVPTSPGGTPLTFYPAPRSPPGMPQPQPQQPQMQQQQQPQTPQPQQPAWTPTPSMRRRNPRLPDYMAPGPRNPLGVRALYLGWTAYRIHGTNAPASIGNAVSNGCIRMLNEDVVDLFERVHIGAPVMVVR